MASSRTSGSSSSTIEITRGHLSPDLIVVDPATRPTDLEWGRLRDALLAIEVSQTSQRRDRAKALLYAATGVPEYWVFHLPSRRIVVHRDPTASGYATSREYDFGMRLRPLFGGPELVTAELPAAS